MSTQACFACKAMIAKTMGGFNVGKFAELHNAHPIFCSGGGLVWLCSSCIPKVRVHVDGLLALFPPPEHEDVKYLHWGSLLQLRSR